MATVRRVKDVSPHELVKAFACSSQTFRQVNLFDEDGSPHMFLFFGNSIELPPWTDTVKTARFKELPPYDPDWYYVRAEHMVGAKRNGCPPPHFCKSSGAIARHILQQLQNVNIIDIDSKGGRRITSNGQRDLGQVAGRIVVTP
ncbi:Small ribosomal subunit protein eS19 - like 1 [Theobroma cacao]|nr:Small ribosomal subunit protein eS19 - like 1 [Theobroma cacao]